MSEVHSQDRTTLHTRAKIKASSASLVKLAGVYNISRSTARKWKTRENPQGLSRRPHKLSTTLTLGQKEITIELCCLTLLLFDDLVHVMREFINPDVSRSGLNRCLRRHAVGNL